MVDGNGLVRKVDDGEARDIRKVAVRARQVVEHGHYLSIAGTLAERGDSCNPHRLLLAGVGRNAQQRRCGDRFANQTESLDQAIQSARLIDSQERRLEADRHMLRDWGSPLFQGALGNHPAEPSVRDEADEPPDGVESREPQAQRPGRVLAHEPATAREQP